MRSGLDNKRNVVIASVMGLVMLGALAYFVKSMFARRPWAAEQQLSSSDRGLNQMRVWDLLGRAFLETGFSTVDAFNAMSAVVSYVLGYAAQEAAAVA